MTEMRTTIDGATKALMQPDSKIGVLATLDGDGWPHVTFISSVQALGERQVTFGKFCTGLSKANLEQRPDAAFLTLDITMRWVRGNARFTHTVNTGEVFEDYNNKPLFRYNTYFGFDHVYIMDLIRIGAIEKLPMPAVIAGAILTRTLRLGRVRRNENMLRHFGEELFGKLDSLKFVSWVGMDGLLELVPIIQASSAGTSRVIFSGVPYGRMLTIPSGAKAAILAVNLQMQSVEVEGICHRSGGLFVLGIERVYNSMPPKMEYVYPRPSRPQAIGEF